MAFKFCNEEQAANLSRTRANVNHQIAELQGTLAAYEAQLAASITPVKVGDKVTWVHQKTQRKGILVEMRMTATPEVEDDIVFSVKCINKNGEEGSVIRLYRSKNELSVDAE